MPTRVQQPIAPGLKADPEVRADGKCALEGCSKPVVRSDAVRKYAGAQIDLEPFHSSRCCRIFHGCTVPGDDRDEQRAEAIARGGKGAAERYLAGKPWIEHDEAA